MPTTRTLFTRLGTQGVTIAVTRSPLPYAAPQVAVCYVPPGSLEVELVRLPTAAKRDLESALVAGLGSIAATYLPAPARLLTLTGAADAVTAECPTCGGDGTRSDFDGLLVCPECDGEGAVTV